MEWNLGGLIGKFWIRVVCVYLEKVDEFGSGFGCCWEERGWKEEWS